MQTSSGRPPSDEAVTCSCHTPTSRRTGERRPSVADRPQPGRHTHAVSKRPLSVQWQQGNRSMNWSCAARGGDSKI